MNEYKEREEARKKMKAMCGDAPAPLTTYESRLKKKMDEVTKEQEQKILDLLHSGKNVGQISKTLGLESIIVAKIYSRNIKSYGSYLAKTITDE